jgi:hypothetical protein
MSRWTHRPRINCAAHARPIGEQVAEHGLTLDPEAEFNFSEDLRSMRWLAGRGHINDLCMRMTRDKILHDIWDSLRQIQEDEMP